MHVFISDGSECECLCVCVWRRSYVTDPRPTRCVRKRRRPPGPFKVKARPGWELRRIKGGGFGSFPSSLSLFFFLVLPPLCSYLFFSVSPYPLLPLSAFHHDRLSVHGNGGKRSRFMMWYSNERRRGDSAVSAQRPHLLSFLFSPYLSESPFLYLSIEDALCSLCSPSTKRTFTTHFA